MEPPRLHLFVYGTLKRGQRNHERFCQGLISAQDATVRGRIYDLPSGFPALVVPEGDVRAVGTVDYLADVDTQDRAKISPQESSPGWDTVIGELFTFDDPTRRLPLLDALEGFHPGEESFYRRILVPTTLTGTILSVVPAWTYVHESARGLHLPSGRWPSP